MALLLSSRGLVAPAPTLKVPVTPGTEPVVGLYDNDAGIDSSVVCLQAES